MARTAKKDKDLTPEEKMANALVPFEEQPYQIPNNWCWVFLTKGIAECKDSLRKPINATIRANRVGDVPYYGATGQAGWIDDYLTDEELVLLGEDGAPFLDVIKDKAYLIFGKAWVNNHAHILKSLFGHVGNLFLLHYLNIFNYTEYVNGTTRLKLTQANMDKIPVPLPPLAEHRRIVERIESLFAKLDEAKEKAQAVVDSFEDRKAAILNLAFSGELTKQWRNQHSKKNDDWETEALEMRFDVVGGIQKTPSRTPKNNPVPYITVANVYREKIDLTDLRYFEVYEGEIEKLRLQFGDILIVEGNGSGNEIGRCAIWRDEIPTCIHQNHIIRARKKDDSVLPEYVLYYLNSPAGKQIMQERAKTTAGLYNLSTGKIKTIPVPFAPINEQKKIVSLLDILLDREQKVKDFAEQIIEQIDTMKKSILARAFRGKLGTNDPNDENAVELLKQSL